MTIDAATPNRAYPLPFGENNLKHDVARVIAALQAIDVDVAAILTALVQKAPLLNAALSGAPTAPTPGSTDNSTRIATTQWVRANFADFVGAAPAALDTIAELAAALQNNPDIITQILTSVGLKAPLASPALSGVPTAPTAAPGTNTTQVATTGFVKAAIDVVLGGVSAAYDTLSEIATAIGLLAPKASPAFTGVPTAPTAAAGNNSTQLATTAYADAIAALKANLASPALTGTPTAPTAAAGTNTTQIATTAMVQSAIAAGKFQKAYESPQQTITAGGSLTLAHGLGVQPKLTGIYLQCVTAENGYAVGDEIVFTATNSNGATIVPDATNLNIRYGSNASPFFANNKNTGTNASISNANWRAVFRAWA